VKAESWDEAVREAELADVAKASGLAKHGQEISERESVDDIEKRLRLLERANRRLTAGLVLTLVLALASFFFPTTNSEKLLQSGSEVTASKITTPRIVTRQLVIVDSDGYEVGAMDSLLNFGRLELKSAENQCEVNPWSIFLNNDKKPRAVITVGHGKDSESEMTLHDDTGKIGLWLTARRHFTRLWLSDHMRPLIQMEYSPRGPSLEYLASPDGLTETIIPKPRTD